MIETDRTQFAALLNKLAIVFKTDLTRDLLDSYFKALRHLTIPKFSRAVERAIESSQFFPKPVELAEYAKEPERYEPAMDGDVCGLCYGAAVIVRTTDRGQFATPCKCTRGQQVRGTWLNTTVGVAAAHNRDKLIELGVDKPE